MSVAIWAGVMVIGGLGSVARFMVDRAVARRTARSFPFGTLTVNITGAVLLGFITTFSTWMFETQRLTEERQIRPALANIAVSVVLGITAAAAGQAIARLL